MFFNSRTCLHRGVWQIGSRRADPTQGSWTAGVRAMEVGQLDYSLCIELVSPWPLGGAATGWRRRPVGLHPEKLE